MEEQKCECGKERVVFAQCVDCVNKDRLSWQQEGIIRSEIVRPNQTEVF